MCSPLNLHGYSDHFPIILESHCHPLDDRPREWQFHIADRNLFGDLCLEAFLQDGLDGGLQLQTVIDN